MQWIFLPIDSCKIKQDNGTLFKILPTCDNPCATSLSSVSVCYVNNDVDDYNCHCCNLFNVVECHVCDNYIV